MQTVWGVDPHQCPCYGGTLRRIETFSRPEIVEIFFQLHGISEALVNIPPPPTPRFDIHEFEPSNPPGPPSASGPLPTTSIRMRFIRKTSSPLAGSQRKFASITNAPWCSNLPEASPLPAKKHIPAARKNLALESGLPIVQPTENPPYKPTFSTQSSPPQEISSANAILPPISPPPPSHVPRNRSERHDAAAKYSQKQIRLFENVGMINAFQLPKDGSIYADSIFTRCRDLIAYQLWSGLQPQRLDAWIANFKTPEERYFGARVLDALIYRSDDQTLALLRQLFSRVLPDYARIHGLSTKLQNSLALLRNPRIEPGLRVVPVIPQSSAPTKSGPIIARHLKRALKVAEQWIIYPSAVQEFIGSVDGFIFVDDFLGTGYQFSDFLHDTGLHSYANSSCFIYGCLAGHEQGIRMLHTEMPSIHVVAVERLNNSHALFHTESGSFPDDLNSNAAARDFYYELLTNRGFNITGPDRRGFGHLEIAYAFEHSVPDNSLPILWWSQANQWRPLFDR